MSNYIAFFSAIKHEHYDYLETTLKEYDIGGYIIGAEVSQGTHKETNGEHFHFLVEMTDTDYHKFSKRVFKDKYKLTGRATSGHPRQYGKVSKIEKLERMKAYTVKDGNFRTNLKDDEVKKITEISFKKEEKQTSREEIIADLNKVELKEWFQEDYGINDYLNTREACSNYYMLSVAVIQSCIENDKPIPAPSVIKRIIIDWALQSGSISRMDKPRLIYALMDIRNPFRG